MDERRRCGEAQLTTSEFDSYDRVRPKPVAEALESFNNLRTKYPAHDRVLNTPISGLKGTDESHIHRRCYESSQGTCEWRTCTCSES